MRADRDANAHPLNAVAIIAAYVTQWERTDADRLSQIPVDPLFPRHRATFAVMVVRFSAGWFAHASKNDSLHNHIHHHARSKRRCAAL